MVGRSLPLVDRLEKVVYKERNWSARGRGEGGGRLPTNFGGPQTTHPSWLTTKSGWLGRKVVYMVGELVYTPVPPSRQRITRFD